MTLGLGYLIGTAIFAAAVQTSGDPEVKSFGSSAAGTRSMGYSFHYHMTKRTGKPRGPSKTSAKASIRAEIFNNAAGEAGPLRLFVKRPMIGHPKYVRQPWLAHG